MTKPPPNWITFNSSTEPSSTKSCRECESSRFVPFFCYLFIYDFFFDLNTSVWQRTKSNASNMLPHVHKQTRANWLVRVTKLVGEPKRHWELSIESPVLFYIVFWYNSNQFGTQEVNPNSCSSRRAGRYVFGLPADLNLDLPVKQRFSTQFSFTPCVPNLLNIPFKTQYVDRSDYRRKLVGRY